MTDPKILDKIDSFTAAYITCALWSSTDESTPQGGEPLDKNYDASDIAPGSLLKIIEVCQDFQTHQVELLSGIDDKQAGHAFWLTRNGHGAGFWDRDLGEVGDALTKACKEYSECNIYVGDDGRLHVMDEWKGRN